MEKYSGYRQNDVFIYDIHPKYGDVYATYLIYINYVVANYPNNSMFNLTSKLTYSVAVWKINK